MKTRRFTLFIVTCSLFIALAFFGCKEDPDPTPQPHTGTITAFGKDITVKGDGSISAANFETAKVKLEEVMTKVDDVFPIGSGDVQNKFVNMLNRDGFAIIIELGNNGSNANTSKQMTIGVDFLIDNDLEPTIISDILLKVVVDDAFAD